MNVTIIGTGDMARGIATRALAGANNVTVLGHQPGEAESLAGELRAGSADGDSVAAGTTGDPLDADVVVLAVPYAAAAGVVEEYGDQLDGKVVIDITNPVDFESFDRLVTPPDSSGAEEIERAASDGARIVKAFNTTLAGTLAEGRVGGQPLDVLIAGDDEAAKTTVAELVEDGGMRPIDTGPLRRARQLEQAGFLHMLVQEPLQANFGTGLKFIS
jgi:8-hydroxy-5-deazaflavin:NADPH oxidoreductase